MNILLTCMYVLYMFAFYPQRPEDGIKSPGTEIVDDCESLWVLGIESRFFVRATSALQTSETFL